ncbi:MAG TPA: RNA polymerase sigma factor SigM [Nocardioides sp.]|nr:RNA polymerase sigma factor SigM [Nocardioides sp.]
MNTPAETEPTDHELLQAHVDGDPDAFATLFRRHRDRLWAVALRTMGNPDDAADGLQDGMIAAYRRAGSFRGEAAVTTWLHRVVVNACLDRIRAAKVRRSDPLPEDLDDVGDRGSLLTSTTGAADPADLAVAQERRHLVLAALDQLPADQRAALVLVDMEGYPVAEVADMLDCAVGTVKSRCSRGRARLAALLGVLKPGGEADHASPGNPDPLPSVRTTEASRAPPDPG